VTTLSKQQKKVVLIAAARWLRIVSPGLKEASFFGCSDVVVVVVVVVVMLAF
jgi:hypothetical protein